MRALTFFAAAVGAWCVGARTSAASEPESAPRAFAFLSADLHVEPDPLGGATTDGAPAIEGFWATLQPFCPGLRIGIDPDSDGEGTSEVRSIEVPLLARAGLCTAAGRTTFQAWAGVGLSYVSVTTEVAGVARTDDAVTSLFGGGIDAVVRFGPLAVLVGLGTEVSGERWSLGGRVGAGAWF